MSSQWKGGEERGTIVTLVHENNRGDSLPHQSTQTWYLTVDKRGLPTQKNILWLLSWNIYIFLDILTNNDGKHDWLVSGVPHCTHSCQPLRTQQTSSGKQRRQVSRMGLEKTQHLHSRIILLISVRKIEQSAAQKLMTKLDHIQFHPSL